MRLTRHATSARGRSMGPAMRGRAGGSPPTGHWGVEWPVNWSPFPGTAAVPVGHSSPAWPFRLDPLTYRVRSNSSATSSSLHLTNSARPRSARRLRRGCAGCRATPGVVGGRGASPPWSVTSIPRCPSSRPTCTGARTKNTNRMRVLVQSTLEQKPHGWGPARLCRRHPQGGWASGLVPRLPPSATPSNRLPKTRSRSRAPAPRWAADA